VQGKARITVTWVDVNKGDNDEPNYSSRFVAREIGGVGESSFFAPTPLLESIRFVLSRAAIDLPGHIWPTGPSLPSPHRPSVGPGRRPRNPT
jgi:hypothetical protein